MNNNQAPTETEPQKSSVVLKDIALTNNALDSLKDSIEIQDFLTGGITTQNLLESSIGSQDDTIITISDDLLQDIMAATGLHSDNHEFVEAIVNDNNDYVQDTIAQFELNDSSANQPYEIIENQHQQDYANKYESKSKSKQTEATPYFCKVCHKYFANPANLSRHQKIIHPNKKQKLYQCSWCDQCCNKRGSLKKHIKRKHKGARGK